MLASLGSYVNCLPWVTVLHTRLSTLYIKGLYQIWVITHGTIHSLTLRIEPWSLQGWIQVRADPAPAPSFDSHIVVLLVICIPSHCRT